MFTPVLAKVLRYLRENPVKETKEHLYSIIGEERWYVNRALEKLVAIKVVAEEDGFYWYLSTPHSEDFFAKMMEICDRVSKGPPKELLIRGLICQIPAHFLFHAGTLLQILENEGLDREELREFLEREMRDGYLRRIRIASIGVPFFMPLYFPAYYVSQLGMYECQGYQTLGEDGKGAEVCGEDYLLGQYPADLAEPAREYIETEKRELREKLRKEVFSTWPRLDRHVIIK